MKGIKTSSSMRAGGCNVGVRLTPEQRARLDEEHDLTGLSRSEILRRRAFGGRPIVANSDTKVILELRRMGGLFKHQLQILRDTAAPEEAITMLQQAYNELARTLEYIRLSFNGS